jgi:hypothetical protein
MTKKTFADALKTLRTTADFYHSMDIDPENDFRYIQWITALELLERVEGLEEGSLLANHDKDYGADCNHPFMVRVWNI